MKIATWNINGVRARIDTALAWLREASPDIVGFQEIKTIDEGFPAAAFEDLGYNVAVHGQKGFNGVALLSKLPFDEVNRGLPGDAADEQARFIEGVVSVPSGVLRVVSLYLPNGNPIGTEKFTYKLAWMERLNRWAAARLTAEEPLVMGGDYNVIPQPRDARDPALWTEDALYQDESRAALRAIEALGYSDALRATTDADGLYTFWDYQAGAWQKDNGIRIDHLLLSPQAADRLISVGIDRHVRSWDKPSDHVPVFVEMNI